MPRSSPRLPEEPAITAIDAAKRQLATAIRLFFEDADTVSVHTLAMAASEIIERTCAANGLQSLRDIFLDAVKPEHRRSASDNMNKPRNFFKHGSGLEEVIANFSDERNDLALFTACHGLEILGHTDPIEAMIFKAWFASVEPDLFLEPINSMVGEGLIDRSREEQKRIGRLALERIAARRRTPRWGKGADSLDLTK